MRPVTGSCTSVLPSGSLIGTDRTSEPRTFTSASVPASATPFSRRIRASASQGITFCAAPPLRCAAGTGVTTTSVAATASKRPTIWLPAVLERPSVATSAATPITVPSTVSATRAGRAIRPAAASEIRSRSSMRGFGSGPSGFLRPGSRPRSARPIERGVTGPPRSDARPPCAPRGARGPPRPPHE